MTHKPDTRTMQFQHAMRAAYRIGCDPYNSATTQGAIYRNPLLVSVRYRKIERLTKA
jgi:hypothetical protein